MRVSEKTIELNFCAQVPVLAGKRLVWFGLTQRQEKRLGFDAAVKLNGRVLLFQFKASNWTPSSGARRFHVSHEQLVALRNNVKRHRRTVFYAFPMIGDSSEIAPNGGDFLSTTWLVDVDDLHAVGKPTRRDGRERLTKRHHVDVQPPHAVFHSEPTSVPMLNAGDFFAGGLRGADGLAPVHDQIGADDAVPDTDALLRVLQRNAVGLVVAQ